MKKNPYSEYLKKRISVVCNCGGRSQKKQLKDRAKFGTSRCDSYSFKYKTGLILSNSLYQYLYNARNAIIRDDWDIIEKHAKAIHDFVTTDDWDSFSDDRDKRFEYDKKERNWREAMHWLTENWGSLWW